MQLLLIQIEVVFLTVELLIVTMKMNEAQCSHEMKFINGEENVKHWKPKEINENSGNGQYETWMWRNRMWRYRCKSKIQLSLG
jgi:hypothetical protein